MIFHGNEGRIQLSAPFNAGQYDFARVNVYNDKNKTDLTYRYPDVRQYRLEAEAFVDAVNNRQQDYFTLENSRLNQRVIDALFRASESGEWEDIS